MPIAGSLSGRVFTTGEPLRVGTPHELDGVSLVTSGELDVGPVMIVPLRGRRARWGADRSQAHGTARVHRGRAGHGRRVRRPGLGGHRAGRGPLRATPGRDARRARSDRRRPARPRHPAALRHRSRTAELAGVAGPGRIADRLHQPRSSTSTTPSARSAPASSRSTRLPRSPRGGAQRLLGVVTDAAVGPRIRARGPLRGPPGEHLPGEVAAIWSRCCAKACPTSRATRTPGRSMSGSPPHPAGLRRGHRRRRRHERHHPPQRPGQPAPTRRTPRRRVHPHPATPPAPVCPGRSPTAQPDHHGSQNQGAAGQALRPCPPPTPMDT